MLSINREPLYKNKILMSSLAVALGFVLTVGIIRAVSPSNESSNQSAQTNDRKKASSLIPVKASDSETSSESNTDAKQNTVNPESNDTAVQPAVGSTWAAPTYSQSGAPSPRTANSPAPSASSNTGSTSTTSQPPATNSGSSGGSTTTQTDGGILGPVTCNVVPLQVCP